MSTRTIYRVYGECGAYSDHTEWDVKAFVDQGAADAFAKKLNDLSGKMESALRGANGGGYYGNPEGRKVAGVFQAELQTMDTSGHWSTFSWEEATYTVTEIELEGDF